MEWNLSSTIGRGVSKSEHFIFPHAFFFHFYYAFCFMPKCKHDYVIVSSVNRTLTATKLLNFFIAVSYLEEF
jgi:hypothetical protein